MKEQYQNIFDLVEEQYTNASTPQLVNKWENFFNRFRKSTRKADGSLDVEKPYIDQIIAMVSAERVIYKKQFGSVVENVEGLPVAEDDEDIIGRKIFQIKYEDLVYAKTDVFQTYEYDNPSDDDEIKNVALDIKILCYQIRNEWDDAHECIRTAVFNLLKKYNTRYADIIQSKGGIDKLYVELTGFEVTKPITGRGSDDLDKFVRIVGRLAQCDDQKSIEVKKTGYRCANCDNVIQTWVRKPPRKCECESTKFDEEPKYRQAEDYMYFVLQDSGEKRRDGQMMPDTIPVSVNGTDMVNSVYNVMVPGTNIAINGVIRLSEIAKNNNQLFSIEFECFGIEPLDNLENSDKIIREQVETSIRRENMTEHYEKLKRSIAPHIQGHEVTKEILLLMAAGSSYMENENHHRIRNELNVLLVGDPGTGKSEFLHFMELLMPGSIYVQGINATEVGLTASLKTNEILRSGVMLKKTILDPGVYGMCKAPGVVCFDEFDKVKSEFHYAACSTATDDFQIMRVDKQTIHTRISVSCGSLMGANPTSNGGMWDVTKIPFKQINFAHWMWDRFDLKVLHLQKRDEQSRHMFWTHKEKTHAKIYMDADEMRKRVKGTSRFDKEHIDKADYYPLEYLRQEMLFIRKQEPTLRSGTGAWMSMKIFWDKYNNMNMIPADQILEEGSQRITFIPVLNERAIYSMTRMAQASARLHRRNTVELEDMEIAIRLMESSIGMFLPGINQDDVDLQSRAQAKVLLNEGIMEAMRLATIQQAEYIKRYAQGMKKLLQYAHRLLFNECNECDGSGHMTDKTMKGAGNPKGFVHEHIPCQGCLGMRGHYDRFTYVDFEEICKQAQVFVNTESYFNLLKKCKFIVREGESMDTTHLKHNQMGDFKVTRELNGKGVIELYVEINRMFGLNDQNIDLPGMVTADRLTK